MSKLLQLLSSFWNHALGRKISTSLIIKVISQFLMFVMMIALARMSNDQEYGIFAYVIAWINILVAVSKLGLNFTIYKYLPVYYKENNCGNILGILNMAITMTLGIAVLMAVLLYFIVPAWKGVGSDRQTVLISMMMILPVLSYLYIKEASLVGIHEVVAGWSPSLIVRPMVMIFMIILFTNFLQKQLTADEMMIMYLASCALALIAISFPYRKKFIDKCKQATAAYMRRIWLRTSFVMFVITLLNLMMIRLDILILGVLSSAENVAYYSAASQIAAVIWFGQFSVNNVMAPVFSERNIQQKKSNLRTLLLKSTAVNIGIAGLLLIPVIALGKFALGLFGDNYVLAAFPLYILCATYFITAVFSPARIQMMMSGNGKYVIYAFTLSIGINIILNAIWIPAFGMVGASSATLISQLVFGLVLMYLLYMNT